MIITDNELELIQEYMFKWSTMIALSKDIPQIKEIKEQIDKGWEMCKEKLNEEQQVLNK